VVLAVVGLAELQPMNIMSMETAFRQMEMVELVETVELLRQ
jgi:hypothetical protein